MVVVVVMGSGGWWQWEVLVTRVRETMVVLVVVAGRMC